MSDATFIARYFDAERNEALLFVVVGAACIVAAAWLWRHRSCWRGMTGPLVAVAAIQLMVGITVAARSDAQAAALAQQHAAAPADFKREEGERMRLVMRRFVLYERIEIGLLAVGVLLLGLARGRQGWRAFGLGLALQAGFMLALDQWAAARGETYLAALLTG